jgi:hypothetical protein
MPEPLKAAMFPAPTPPGGDDLLISDLDGADVASVQSNWGPRYRLPKATGYDGSLALECLGPGDVSPLMPGAERLLPLERSISCLVTAALV